MAKPGRAPRIFSDDSRYLDRFGLLLAVTSASVVLLALVSIYQPGETLVSQLLSVGASCFVAVSLMLALRAAGVAGRYLRIIGALVFVALVILLVTTLHGPDASLVHDDTPIPAPAVLTLLSAIAPLVVVRRLTQHHQVTRATMFGAVCAYLLIPITYFYAFLTVNGYSSEPFFGVDEPSQSYMYFSLTTLATVGYGDLTAQSDLGRLLANSEALVGQIYLVCVVALLVGLFAQQWLASRQALRDTQASDDADASSRDRT